MDRLRKRWTDTVKECLKKRWLDVRQAMRRVQDRSKWRRFVRGKEWGREIQKNETYERTN